MLDKCEKPRQMPGLLSWSVQEKSVLRDDRATPVEAVDELGGRLLRVDTAGLVQDAANGAAVRNGTKEGVGLVAQVRETNFVLPEQSGKLADGVFGAAADEPAVPSAASRHDAGRERRGDSGRIDEVGAFKVRLGITGVEVGQKSGESDETDTSADGPGIVVLE